MGRKKGVKNKVKEEVKLEELTATEAVETLEVKQPKVGRLTSDFGREDLNQLRNKVNEILDLVDPL